MDPVSAQYKAIADYVDFWKERRARPITEWTPLPPDAAQALLTGWFVARLLGRARISKTDGLWHEVFCEATRATPAGWRRLHSEGVRPITRVNELVIILEMIALAFIDAYQENSLAPLEPYRQLIDLGASVGHVARPDPVKRWVETGRGVEDQRSCLLGTASFSSAKERADALIAKMSSIADAYERHTTPDRLADIESAQVHMVAECIGLVKQALTQITASAVTMSDDDDMGH